MKPTHKLPRLAACCSCLAALLPEAAAQYAPPPSPAPFAGFLNEHLRAKDTAWKSWDLSGSVRLRYELRENHLAAPPNSDFATAEVARSVNPGGISNDNSYLASKVLARVGYTDKWWGALVEGRSSAVTGDSRGSAPNIASGSSPESDGPVELHQAFVTLGNLKEFPLSLKAGRQELNYGDQRVIGGFAWNNIGRVFDAAKVRWQNGWFGVDAFTGRIVVPDDNNFNVANDYEWFSGLYFDTKKLPGHSTEVYALARNVGTGAASFNAPNVTPAPFNTSARDIYTLGVRLRSATNWTGNFDYTVELAGQLGNWKRPATGVRANERDDHEAFAAAVNVGYTLPDVAGRPRFALEYAFGSGDSDPNDGTHGTFDNLYPTNHKFYGYMDLVPWQNVHDIRAIFTMKPVPRLSTALEAHALWLADTEDRFYNVAGIARQAPGAAGAPGSGRGYGLNPGYDSFLGYELDVVAGYALTKFATIEAGYAHFFRGNYVRQTFSEVGSQDADWFYAQLLVRF